MKKEFNIIESIGWILFSIVILSFLLILGAEPTFDDEPKPKHSDIIALVWFGTLVFSILLMTFGKRLNNK
tara:strand:- start:606 stop:815 length:210 start_codon:yes stop_codon:yes gene_type:complete